MPLGALRSVLVEIATARLPRRCATIELSRFPLAMPKQRWKQFESLVAKIQADLAGEGAEVTLDDKILGKTGALRQIDISIRCRAGQFTFLVVIDCKDHGHPLDVKDVEEFIGMVQDVGAHRAALVSAKGYSETAKTRAKMAQIDLYTVVDTGDHPWRVDVSVPALYQYAAITEIGIDQVCRSRYAADAEIAVPEIAIFDMNERLLGRFVDLLHAKWNAGELPNCESGEYHDLKIVPNPVKVADYKGELHTMDVYAYIRVEVSKYFGRLPLTQCSGLCDVSTGHTITRQIVTAAVGRELEKTWTRIQNTDQLAVRPVMTFECYAAYGDLPDDDDPNSG